MAASLRKFEIVLDSSDKTFAPGEKITGRVIVELSRIKSIRGLRIKFLGSGQVRWSETEGSGKDGRETWFAGNEEYFNTQFHLLGGAGNNENVEIQPGNHVFPFDFSLPHKLPCTFEYQYGSVRYTIEAVMDRPWKFNHETSTSFTVDTPCDLSQNPAAKVVIEDSEYDTFCCFLPCFTMGSMSTKIYVSASGFAIGESIEARISINNESSSVDVTKIALHLEQEITLHAQLPHPNSKKDSSFVQNAEKTGPFRKKDEISIGMQVPAVPPTNLPHCSLIEVKYSLYVLVAVSGCHCNTTRMYPILIGTRPALNRQPVPSANVIPEPLRNPSPIPPVQPSAPSAEFLSSKDSTPSSMPLLAPGGEAFPEKAYQNHGPTPYPLNPMPPYGFAMASQPYPQPMPGSSSGQTFQYPPATVASPAIGFVCPTPEVTSTTEKPPPSYDDCVDRKT